MFPFSHDTNKKRFQAENITSVTALVSRFSKNVLFISALSVIGQLLNIKQPSDVPSTRVDSSLQKVSQVALNPGRASS